MIQLWKFVETTLSRETEHNLSWGRGSLTIYFVDNNTLIYSHERAMIDD